MVSPIKSSDPLKLPVIDKNHMALYILKNIRLHLKTISSLLITITICCTLSGGEISPVKLLQNIEKKVPPSKCPEGMVNIPAGMVTSKKSEEQKGNTLIYLDEFCIDTYEYPNKKGEMPSTNVTWFEAETYCKKEGKRLCKGEEWEKACAGKNWFKFSYGDTFQPPKCGQGGIVRKDVDKTGTHPDCVSGFGVYDMIGGVWEWTSDPAYKTYVKRGGYINAGPDEANCFFRLPQAPKQAANHDGFRCCLDVPPELRE
jgi:hypothetical protein